MEMGIEAYMEKLDNSKHGRPLLAEEAEEVKESVKVFEENRKLLLEHAKEQELEELRQQELEELRRQYMAENTFRDDFIDFRERRREARVIETDTVKVSKKNKITTKRKPMYVEFPLDVEAKLLRIRNEAGDGRGMATILCALIAEYYFKTFKTYKVETELDTKAIAKLPIQKQYKPKDKYTARKLMQLPVSIKHKLYKLRERRKESLKFIMFTLIEKEYKRLFGTHDVEYEEMR